MRRCQWVKVDIKWRYTMDIRKVVFRFIVDRIRRNNIFVTRWVVAKLEPAHATKECVKDSLLHLALGVHLL